MDLSGQWDYILNTARQRLANNKTEHHVARFGTQIEVRGAAGELAARLHLGLEPKLHTHFDGGIDFEYAGRTIDVKTTKLVKSLPFRRLQWPAGKPLRADLILWVAVNLTQKSASVIGYATAEQVIHATINESRPIRCHEVHIEDLQPVWNLEIEQSYRQWIQEGTPHEEINPI